MLAVLWIFFTPYPSPLTLDAWAAESLIIAASPGLARPIEALSRRFESTHPQVRVRVSYDSALSLRQTIATVENRGPYFIGTGPIHLIAPGGDELIARLQQKYYVLPGTTTTYASVPLALVVPESLVDAPASFEAAARDTRIRIAIADPELTALGQETIRFLEAASWGRNLTGRLDIAADAAGVLDHLLNGKADVAIVSGPDAAREQERVRVIDVASGSAGSIKVHSMAMERTCPNRALCREFLEWIRTAEAQAVLRGLGYGPPPHGRADAAAH
ncbi:molybdate ABC transporter substrate-binding protein [Nitrospira moscoviensis]|uniref:molybdate ABC transporter substrate-binding protein n=1 Tax=Nitrospira moscoviensis TaxID=42253 RepID=UPI0016517C40|nr:substrate-binding domain-containing protein [Nitrospira moscoviensis]